MPTHASNGIHNFGLEMNMKTYSSWRKIDEHGVQKSNYMGMTFLLSNNLPVMLVFDVFLSSQLLLALSRNQCQSLWKSPNNFYWLDPRPPQHQQGRLATTEIPFQQVPQEDIIWYYGNKPAGFSNRLELMILRKTFDTLGRLILVTAIWSGFVASPIFNVLFNQFYIHKRILRASRESYWKDFARQAGCLPWIRRRKQVRIFCRYKGARVLMIEQFDTTEKPPEMNRTDCWVFQK